MAAGCAPGSRYRRNPLSLVSSAARGIAVHLGAKFSVLPSNHLRVATSTLTIDAMRWLTGSCWPQRIDAFQFCYGSASAIASILEL